VVRRTPQPRHGPSSPPACPPEEMGPSSSMPGPDAVPCPPRWAGLDPVHCTRETGQPRCWEVAAAGRRPFCCGSESRRRHRGQVTAAGRPPANARRRSVSRVQENQPSGQPERAVGSRPVNLSAPNSRPEGQGMGRTQVAAAQPAAAGSRLTASFCFLLFLLPDQLHTDSHGGRGEAKRKRDAGAWRLGSAGQK